MIIVAGHLLVDPDGWEAYLETCREVVAAARNAPDCLDFALSPDLLNPGRVNIFERWTGREPLDRFRGAGTPDEQAGLIRSASVAENDATAGSTLG